MDGSDRKACAYCRFWHPWKTVALVDDEPQLLGHCVVILDHPHSPNIQEVYIHGLTGNDFCCDAFKDVDR
jgi:hypothetical protein